MIKGRKLAENSSIRQTILNAAVTDMKGGDTLTGVRWFIKYCTFCRRVPIRSGLSSRSSAAAILERGSLVLDFVIWLVTCEPSGVRISIRSAFKYLSEVRAWHRRRFDGEELHGETTASQLSDLRRALKRILPEAAKKVRFGIRTQHLAEAMDKTLSSGSPAALTWRALLSLAFCGLLRGAEVAVQEGDRFSAVRHLTRADLDFAVGEDGRQLAIVTMRVAKRVGAVKETKVVIGGGGTIVDAVAELRRLYEFWEADDIPREEWKDTPMFKLDGDAVGVRQVRGMVKYLMTEIGENPAHFGAHSMRIGGASAAYAAGIEPSAIRIAGRWSSDIYEIYVRLSARGAARLGATIGSTSFEDLERGTFASEELELLPTEMMKGFSVEKELIAETRADNES